MKLNENIKTFRCFNNITQQELADMLNKSKNVISNWERGENQPDPDLIEKMCRIFHVTPNQIFGWEPNPDIEEFLKMDHERKRRLEELEAKKKMLNDEIASIQRQISQEKIRFTD